MTNDQTAMLARYGIDYAEAMERFCGCRMGQRFS